MLSQSLRRASTSAGETSRRKAHHASERFSSFLSGLNDASSSTPKRPRTTPSDMKKVKQTSKGIVSGMKQANNPEWRFTYGRSKDSQRLRQDMLNKNRRQQVDETLRVFEESPIESMTIEELLINTSNAGSKSVSPGTYFEMRRNADVLTGIVVGKLDGVGKAHDLRALTLRGESATLRSSDIMFSIPSFIDANLIKRCGMGEMHENDHEFAARLRALQQMKLFEREVEKEQNRFGRDIRTIYDKLRAKSPEEWGKVTTMQVARMLNSSPNVPVVTMYAVHKQLMDRPDEFLAHPSRHRFNHTFDVRPFSQLRIIRQTAEWTKGKNPIVTGFQEKARRLIDESRKIANESWDELPSIADSLGVAFTEEEQVLIEFLKLHVTNKGRNTQADPLDVHVPAIIQDTNRYDDLITAFVTLTFLREIGVWTPWEDLASKARYLHLTEAELYPSISARSDTAAGTSTVGLLTEDAHENVRHDFGDTPVFVIDDAAAEELDDGISIERIPGEPDSVWLHMHVADPTSIIPITHPLSRSIQKRPESLYFNHKTIPMLPSDIGKIADIGHAGVRRHGQNVLTFSAKVSSKGKLLDQKICAGRIKNVKRFTYSDVNEALGLELGPEFSTPFEDRATVAIPKADVSHVMPHIEDLKLALSVTRAVVEERNNSGSFSFSTPQAEVKFLDKPVPESALVPDHAVLYRGFPRRQYQVIDPTFTEQGSRSLVGECMKLAARVAARFCVEHKIPAIYRGLPKPTVRDEAQMARILEKRDTFGLVEAAFLAKEGVNFQAGDISMEPVEHWAIGIPAGEGYIRATSPLRRADDMFMHWQIKGMLLPKSDSGRDTWPITSSAMARIIEELTSSFQALKIAKRAHSRQWACEYILRYIETLKRNGQWEGPNPLRDLEGTVVTDPTYNLVLWEYYQDIFLPSLGLKGFLPLKTREPYEIGSKVKVDIKSVFQHDLNHNLMLELPRGS